MWSASLVTAGLLGRWATRRFIAIPISASDFVEISMLLDFRGLVTRAEVLEAPCLSA